MNINIKKAKIGHARNTRGSAIYRGLIAVEVDEKLVELTIPVTDKFITSVKSKTSAWLRRSDAEARVISAIERGLDHVPAEDKPS